MNKRTALITLSVIIVISLVLYYMLGGFTAVQYSSISNSRYLIIGKEYVGVNNSNELENLFSEAKSNIESKSVQGTLVIVNDDEKYDDEYNQIGYFIGILVDDLPVKIPEGYVSREFGSVKVIRARIESHNLVMPKPDKVKQKARKLAESEGMKLSLYSVEKYFDSGTLEVDFLLVK